MSPCLRNRHVHTIQSCSWQDNLGHLFWAWHVGRSSAVASGASHSRAKRAVCGYKLSADRLKIVWRQAKIVKTIRLKPINNILQTNGQQSETRRITKPGSLTEHWLSVCQQTVSKSSHQAYHIHKYHCSSAIRRLSLLWLYFLNVLNLCNLEDLSGFQTLLAWRGED